MREIKEVGIFLCLLSVLALAACSLDAAGNEGKTPEPERIALTVEGPVFRPLLQFSSSARVEIDWGDGSPGEVTEVAFENPRPAVTTKDLSTATVTVSRIFEHEYAAEGPRKVLLTVTPWSALTVLNLGYRAGDGGNSFSITDGADIAFNPPVDSSLGERVGNAGDTLNVWDNEENILRGYVGTVTAVENLDAATRLEAFCCEQQLIEELDCSNLKYLRNLEGYFSTLKTVSLQGAQALRRCCLEQTGATGSWRTVNGARVDEDSMDLQDCPLLQDIRGTGDDHSLLRIHPDALSSIWHLCKMGNSRFTAICVGEDAPAPLDAAEWSALYQCWISSSPIITDFNAVNPELGSVWAEYCGITNITLSALGLQEATFQGNPLSAVSVETIPSLTRLDLSNCGLTEAQVDTVLARFVALRPESVEGASLVLSSNRPDSPYVNARPSADGLADVTVLRERGWTVQVNE